MKKSYKLFVWRGKGKNDIEELSNFIKSVIKGTSYYSEKGKKHESSRYSLNNLKTLARDTDQLFCVCKKNGKIIGFNHGEYDCGAFWGNWIGVAPEYRGNGVAQRLIKFRENILRKNGVHKIWCDTHYKNKEAQAMFKKMGYKKIAKLTNHWYNDDFYLWQKLIKKKV